MHSHRRMAAKTTPPTQRENTASASLPDQWLTRFARLRSDPETRPFSPDSSQSRYPPTQKRILQAKPHPDQPPSLTLLTARSAVMLRFRTQFRKNHPRSRALLPQPKTG